MILALSLLVGFGAGTLGWMLASHFVAVWVNRVEDKRPELIASAQLRFYEIAACAFVFVVCLALALSLSRVLWLQWK